MVSFLRLAFGSLMAICTIGPGLDWLWQAVMGADSNPPTLWVLTFLTMAAILALMARYCGYRQRILSDEVERCCKAKSELERQVLKHRKSSHRRGH